MNTDDLRWEIERLTEAKRSALALADNLAKSAVEMRAEIERAKNNDREYVYWARRAERAEKEIEMLRATLEEARAEIERLRAQVREAFRAGFWAYCAPGNAAETIIYKEDEDKAWAEWSASQQSGGQNMIGNSILPIIQLEDELRDIKAENKRLRAKVQQLEAEIEYEKGPIPYDARDDQQDQIKEPQAEIERLRRDHDLECRLRQTMTELSAERWEEIKKLESCLNSRDDFLGKTGQWQAYVDSLPRNEQGAKIDLPPKRKIYR